ncbi:unnamed protein product [Rhodiola kirilowii]
MHLVSWNIRGVNGRKKQQAIQNLRRKHRMDMLFIQESKMAKHEGRVVSTWWGGDKICWRSADAVGSSGGLVTIWDPEFLQIRSEHLGRRFILIQGSIKCNNIPVLFNFVNVYAPLGENEKLALWEELASLKDTFKGEWVVGGDFNSFLGEEERRGSAFNSKDASLFHDFVQAMGLVDMPLRGRRFTWGNKLGASRLDRFLISPEVMVLWPNLEQRGLDKGLSDHVAVALLEEGKCSGFKPFRMLNVWLDQPGVKKMIIEAWKSKEGPGWKSFNIQRKLSNVRVKLAQWNKQGSRVFKLRLLEARKEWERLSLLQDERGLSEEENLKKLAIQKRIWQLEIQEEKIWRQKSRISWLKEGDLNTKFFHSSATWRHNKNRISGILVNGSWVEDPELIKQAACEYFRSIFRSSDACIWALERVNFASVSESQREFLEGPISREEVLSALKSCDGNKAPGPDGFNMNFFKKNFGSPWKTK